MRIRPSFRWVSRKIGKFSKRLIYTCVVDVMISVCMHASAYICQLCLWTYISFQSKFITCVCMCVYMVETNTFGHILKHRRSKPFSDVTEVPSYNLNTSQQKYFCGPSFTTNLELSNCMHYICVHQFVGAHAEHTTVRSKPLSEEKCYDRYSGVIVANLPVICCIRSCSNVCVRFRIRLEAGVFADVSPPKVIMWKLFDILFHPNACRCQWKVYQINFMLGPCW